MANMSYCRFRNTERDLRDCVEALENGEGPDEHEDERYSEAHAAIEMRELCERYLTLTEYLVKN